MSDVPSEVAQACDVIKKTLKGSFGPFGHLNLVSTPEVSVCHVSNIGCDFLRALDWSSSLGRSIVDASLAARRECGDGSKWVALAVTFFMELVMDTSKTAPERALHALELRNHWRAISDEFRRHLEANFTKPADPLDLVKNALPPQRYLTRDDFVKKLGQFFAAVFKHADFMTWAPKILNNFSAYFLRVRGSSFCNSKYIRGFLFTGCSHVASNVLEQRGSDGRCILLNFPSRALTPAVLIKTGEVFGCGLMKKFVSFLQTCKTNRVDWILTAENLGEHEMSLCDQFGIKVLHGLAVQEFENFSHIHELTPLNLNETLDIGCIFDVKSIQRFWLGSEPCVKVELPVDDSRSIDSHQFIIHGLDAASCEETCQYVRGAIAQLSTQPSEKVLVIPSHGFWEILFVNFLQSKGQNSESRILESVMDSFLQLLHAKNPAWKFGNYRFIAWKLEALRNLPQAEGFHGIELLGLKFDLLERVLELCLMLSRIDIKALAGPELASRVAFSRR